MKPKTDEEILAIKHKLEAKGYTWETTKTDEEWIAKYRYTYAEPKVLIKRRYAEIKQWIIIHPRTTLCYGMLLFLFGILSYPAILAMQTGAELMNGKITIAPLSMIQLTGFTMLLASMVFFIFAFGVLYMFSHGTWSVIQDDENAYKRKLRRKELASSLTHQSKGEET